MAKKNVIPENPTLQDVCDAYLASLARDGRTSGTAASYANDLKVATKYFGAATPVRDLTVDRVRDFFDAPVVTTKRNGTPKNEISIAKTRRILRLALVWAANAKWIATAPIPPKAAGDATTDATPIDEPQTPVAVADPTLDLTPFDHPEMVDVTDAEKAAQTKRRAKKAKTATAE